MCRAGGRRLRQLRRAEEEEEKRETPPPPSYTQKLLRDPPTAFPNTTREKERWNARLGGGGLHHVLVVQVYSWAEEAARQVHEGESRVSPFAGVGASDFPPPIVQRATHPPAQTRSAQKWDHIFPSLEGPRG